MPGAGTVSCRYGAPVRSTTALTLALVAPFVLAACGPSEDDMRHKAFCERVPELLDEIRMNLSIGSTVGGDYAIDVLSDQIDKLEKVEPPNDVADEWGAMVDTTTRFRDLLAEALAAPPEDQSAYLIEIQPFQQELTDNGAAVDEWGQANC
jgi:hypothetical protein